MSAATKRKHVVKEMLEDFSMPRIDQTIVKVLGNAGSNLHEIVTPAGQRSLASLPTKFRRNIWIKRGDFVVVEPIAEGNKVTAEIVRILYPQHIKEIKQSNLWPSEFEPKPIITINTDNKDSSHLSSAGEETDSDDDFDIPRNTNRPPTPDDYSDDETSSEDDE